METKKKKGYCKCGRKLKKINIGISVAAEPRNIDEPYDGSYKKIFFSFCDKCHKKNIVESKK